MLMAWLCLLAAVIAEVAMIYFIKRSAGFSLPGPSIGVVLSAAFGMYMLSRATLSIPISTAYPIWTGLGGVGALVLGAALFGETVSTAKLVCVGLILAGVVGLKLNL